MFKCRLVFVLAVGATSLFFCSAQTHQCYVCGEPDEVSCQDFNASIRFVSTCPNGYTGCLTEIKDTSVIRSCASIKVKKTCKNLQGTIYCYCPDSLCNGPILKSDYVEESTHVPVNTNIENESDETEYTVEEDSSDEDDDDEEEEDDDDDEEHGEESYEDDYISEDKDGNVNDNKEEKEKEYDEEETDKSDNSNDEGYYDGENDWSFYLQNFSKKGTAQNTTNSTTTTPSSISPLPSSSSSSVYSSSPPISSIPVSEKYNISTSHTTIQHDLTTKFTQGVTQEGSDSIENKIYVSSTTELPFSRAHRADTRLFLVVCLASFASVTSPLSSVT